VTQLRGEGATMGFKNAPQGRIWGLFNVCGGKNYAKRGRLGCPVGEGGKHEHLGCQPKKCGMNTNTDVPRKGDNQ